MARQSLLTELVDRARDPIVPAQVRVILAALNYLEQRKPFVVESCRFWRGQRGLWALALITQGSACSLFSMSDAELLGGSSTAGAGGAHSSGSSSLGGSPHAGTNNSGSSGSSDAGEPAAGGSGEQGSPGGAPAEGGAPSALKPGPALEAPIPQEGLVLWLTTEHGVGMADGGVEIWQDASGNALEAKQWSVSARPKLVTVVELEQDMLEFDGVDDMLALDEGFGDFSRGLTAFVVAVALDDRPCASVLQLSNSPQLQDIDIGRQNGSIHYEVGEQAITGPANAFALNQTVVLGVIHEPTPNADLRINSVYMQSDALALPEQMMRQNNFVGRSLYSGCELFKGRVGVILLYNVPFTFEQRQMVEDYLDAKWSFEPNVTPKPKPDDVIAK